MNTLPNIEHLYIFTKIVEAGSLSKAGEILRIPKPSMSRKLTQLEDDIGAQLFLRSSKGIKPTEIGKKLYSACGAIFNTLDSFRDTISEVKREPQGLLKITAGVEFGIAVLNTITSQYSNMFPKVTLDVELTGRKVDLAFENIDIAIRIGPLKDSNLKSRKLGEFRYGLFASPNFIKKYKTKLKSIDSLESLPTLVFKKGIHDIKWTFVSDGEKRTIELNPRSICNNHWMLIESARNDVGIAFCPNFLAKSHIDRGDLIQIHSSYRSESIPITAVFPNQQYMNPLTRSFLDFLTRKLDTDYLSE
ncbi:MAG: LysR family transcriptional regulator [Pseudobacteriovorax sp.]|nr:LysR family transcriptional regulator [Pseudobacteriovorax sp.]